jgi:two-component system CheB/CheR fusion protein
MTVSDTGRGIAPEFLPFIFDMFRQANSGTNRQYGGMGIGLALVKELVQSHGGRVEVASNGEGQGAQFRVALPLVHVPRAVRSLPGEPMNNLTGKRILLVEDAVETLEVLQELLRSEGAAVTSAASGAVALEMVDTSSEAYDLIISDIGMPGMDGFQLLAELRKRQATTSTPAIALSGFTRPADVHRALKAGFATHVRKPVVLDQFLATAGRISN